MLNCRKCDFLIKPEMRHAMVNNCCPSCGSAILGDTYVQRMKLFKQRVLSQAFSQTLSDATIFDITLFMLMEFSSPNVTDPEKESAEDKDPVEVIDAGAEESLARKLEDYEQIREEIREEVSSSTEEEADEDLKIARLKRLAKESTVRLSGASVRRLGGD